MIFDELGELKDLVEALEVLDKAGMDITIDIKQIRIFEKTVVSIGNVDHKFWITLDSDGIENLMGNSKRVKVTK